MPSAKKPIAIRKLDGRNPTDPPHDLPNELAQEVQNIDFYKATLGRRRPGSASDTTVFAGITAVGPYYWLQSHMPDDNEANRELWGAELSNTSATRIVARDGAAVASKVLKDAVQLGQASKITGTSFNGKLYLCYPTTDTDLNRLHVWDSSDTEVRRVGLGALSNTADTFASVGAGSGLDFQRFYKFAWVDMVGTTVKRRSELSPSYAVTPNTSATGARLTQPGGNTTPTFDNEKQTHWEAYADTADTSGTFYRIARVVVDANTATTYDDGAAGISGYNTLTACDDTGTNTPPKGAKFVVADENRLIMGSNFITSSTAPKSELEFTPRLGDRDIGDDERIVRTGSQVNKIDLGEGDGSGLTGLAGPIFGSFYAFKFKQIWKLVPTGVVDSPYRPVNISRTTGCIEHRTLVSGRDNTGQEALYFMSHLGPYKVGANGLEYLGHAVEDYRPNLAATGTTSHAIFLSELKQVWFWVATGSENTPQTILVFDITKGVADKDGVIRRGWSIYKGPLAQALCSTMMSKTLGASMSADHKPYVALNDTDIILKGDNTSLSADRGTGYQALIKFKAIDIGGLTKEFGMGKTFVLAKKGDTATKLDLVLERDFGLETRTFTEDLSGNASADRVVKVFETDLADAGFVEVQIGDTASATSKDWQLDAIEFLMTEQGTK